MKIKRERYGIKTYIILEDALDLQAMQLLLIGDQSRNLSIQNQIDKLRKKFDCFMDKRTPLQKINIEELQNLFPNLLVKKYLKTFSERIDWNAEPFTFLGNGDKECLKKCGIEISKFLSMGDCRYLCLKLEQFEKEKGIEHRYGKKYTLL